MEVSREPYWIKKCYLSPGSVVRLNNKSRYPGQAVTVHEWINDNQFQDISSRYSIDDIEYVIKWGIPDTFGGEGICNPSVRLKSDSMQSTSWGICNVRDSNTLSRLSNNRIITRDEVLEFSATAVGQQGITEAQFISLKPGDKIKIKSLEEIRAVMGDLKSLGSLEYIHSHDEMYIKNKQSTFGQVVTVKAVGPSKNVAHGWVTATYNGFTFSYNYEVISHKIYEDSCLVVETEKTVAEQWKYLSIGDKVLIKQRSEILAQLVYGDFKAIRYDKFKNKMELSGKPVIIQSLDSDSCKVRDDDGEEYTFHIEMIAAILECKKYNITTPVSNISDIEWANLKEGDQVELKSREEVRQLVDNKGKIDDIVYFTDPDCPKYLSNIIKFKNKVYGTVLTVDHIRSANILECSAQGQSYPYHRQLIKRIIKKDSCSADVSQAQASDHVHHAPTMGIPCGEIPLGNPQPCIPMSVTLKTNKEEPMKQEEIEKLGKENLTNAVKEVAERRAEKKQKTAESRIDYLLANLDSIDASIEQYQNQRKPIVEELKLLGYDPESEK